MGLDPRRGSIDSVPSLMERLRAKRLAEQGIVPIVFAPVVPEPLQRVKPRLTLTGPTDSNESATVTAYKRREVVARTCRHCGVTFHTQSQIKVYCSDACRIAAKRPPMRTIACEVCGTGFIVSGFDKMNTRRFCSLPCKSKGRASRKHKAYAPINCVVCNVAFVPEQSNARFCSPACGGKRSHWRYRKERGDAMSP